MPCVGRVSPVVAPAINGVIWGPEAARGPWGREERDGRPRPRGRAALRLPWLDNEAVRRPAEDDAVAMGGVFAGIYAPHALGDLWR